jgi:GxxExxY protein
MTQLIFKNEVFAIVGSAMEVHRELGPGFLEAVYQEALELELGYRNIPFESQRRLAINYKNDLLSQEYIADLVCYKTLIVELKASEKLTRRDKAQILHYLKATGIKVGVLLNFGCESLVWERFVV